MPLSFLAEPLRSAVDSAITLCNGTVTQSGNTIQVAGSHELMRSMSAIASTLHHEAAAAGLTIELLDADAQLTTAGVLGINGAPFSSASGS